MREWDIKPLVPDRVLGVGNDAGARHGGPRDGNRDVRVASDNLAVVDDPLVVGGGLGPARTGAGSEAAAEVLGG